MKVQQFDDLTRLIGTGTSRRRVLKGLVGGIAAGVLGFTRQAATSAQECVAEGEACAADTDCCEGICCAGFCRNIECCIDEEDPNARCPEGTSCFEGVCDSVDGTCGVLGDPCDIANENADCCNGLVCFEAICDNPSGLCMGVAEFCGDDALECCGGLTCVDGYCEGTCAAEGEACQGDDDCCDGFVCSDQAVCEAATGLPSTGVGVDDASWSPLMGASLAAGAAALYAANKLRTHPDAASPESPDR